MMRVCSERLLTLTMLPLLIGLTGCQKKEEPAAPAPAPPTEAKAEPQAEPQPEPPAQPETKSTAGKFAYTEAPTIDKVPATPPEGLANGRPLKIQTVLIQPGLGGWDLVLLERKMDKPTDVGGGGQSVNIELPERPIKGKLYTHKMSYGGGYFQIGKTKVDDTTSWNADNAWVLRFGEFAAKPYDPKGEMFQVAGKAAGKIAVCYKAASDIKASWVAGTFTDAIVRYMGKPEEAQIKGVRPKAK